MLIVALYINDVPVPSAQVIVPNAQWTFLLGWKPDYRALTHHTMHSQANSMLLCLGFSDYLVKGNIYVRQFLQVSEVSSFSRVPPSFPPPRSQSSVPWERGCGISGSPDIGDLYRGPFGDLGKKGRACSLGFPAD